MTPEKLAFINLVAKLGLETAFIVWENVNKNATIDDAIVALRKSTMLGAEDFAKERQKQ